MEKTPRFNRTEKAIGTIAITGLLIGIGYGAGTHTTTLGISLLTACTFSLGYLLCKFGSRRTVKGQITA
jgi:hypothetical protein